MTGAERWGGALFAVVWAVILWTRKDVKGVGIRSQRRDDEQDLRFERHEDEQDRRYNDLVAALIDAEEDETKRKLFTDLLRKR